MGVKSKRFLISFIMLFMLLGCNIAQERDPRITLNYTNISLEKLLEKITYETGLRFSYNPNRLDLDTIISVNYINLPLTGVLESFTDYGISYRVMESHIILRRIKIGKTSSSTEEKYTISGFIRDTNSGEVLIGATIGDASTGYGTATNAYGYYSLSIPYGTYELKCSYVGYETSDLVVTLTTNTEKDIALKEMISRLDEVIIVVDNVEKEMSDMSSGELTIRASSIKNIPGMLGESDVLKSIQSLPGINFYSDGSTIFHVRGGDRDQNLILIDEAPIYNPAHLLGLFSAFTPESINSISILRGDMPASYGGRLSSVIDVKLKDGNSHSLIFSGTTGPIASTLNLEGPMFGDHSSFYLSARRSHLKWIIDLNTNGVEKLHFSDFNLKYNYRINRNNRILLSYYSGLDMFRSRPSQTGSSGITWINNAGNLRWNHIFNEKLFSNTSFIISSYDYNLYTNFEAKERWNTGIGLGALKSDFSYYANPRATYKLGIYLATHTYSPGNYYVGILAQPVTRGVSARKARESALYFSNENRIGSRINVRYGLRFTVWQNAGRSTEYTYDENFFPQDTTYYSDNTTYNSFASAEPRVTIKYKFTDRIIARLSWAKNSQFEYLISNSVSPFTSLETWLPASPNIKPMSAHQVTAGLTMSSRDHDFVAGIEGFYKKMNNYIGYVDHAYMLFNPHVEGEIRYGEGRSFGAEVYIKRDNGRLNGSISYSHSRTLITIPDINNGNTFPSVYDRPNSANVHINYLARKRWTISATWVYSTGSPVTTPTGYYFYNGYQVPFYDKRNNDRLPDYHRLDLSTEIKLNNPGKRYKHALRLSVLNVYGRENPFTVNFNKIINENGSIVVPADYSEQPDLVSSMMYIYGTIPSISYSFEF